MTDNEYRRLILSTRAALILPALWSVVTGGLAGLTSVAVLVAFDLERERAISAAVGAVAMLISWLVSMVWWLRQWRRVRDGKSAQMAPDQPKAAVRVEYHQEAGRVITIDNLEHVTPEQLRKIAVKVAKHENITTTYLLSIFDGSRVDMEACRDELMQRGYMRWNSETAHQQGISFTAKGRALLTHFATSTRDSSGFSRTSRPITQDTTEDLK